MRAIGDLLGLYDPDRLRSPVHKGAPAKWDEAEKALTRTLLDARLANKPVLLLTGAIVSPTQKALIEDLQTALPTLLHAPWEPVAPLPEICAMKALYGKAVFSKPHLDRADVILSLQADFLGTDTNAPVFVQDFAARRAISSPSDSMNRLWVLEGGMSLTGSNADQRLQVRPSKIAAMAFAIARLLHESHSLRSACRNKSRRSEGFRSRRIGRQPECGSILIKKAGRGSGTSPESGSGPGRPRASA